MPLLYHVSAQCGFQTYVGEILVAMNPFMTIPGLYDLKKQIEYCDIGDRSSKCASISRP